MEREKDVRSLEKSRLIIEELKEAKIQKVKEISMLNDSNNELK